jgi:enoyl-CoA hydratase/carnithine racemase
VIDGLSSAARSTNPAPRKAYVLPVTRSRRLPVLSELDPSAGPHLLLQLGPITRLTLNRPALANALDVEMGRELSAAVAEIRRAPETRVVVLSGAGEHFCSGGDFSFIEENTWLDSAVVEQRMLSFYRSFLCLLDLPVPTLARVRGSAIGAGLCLALACDLRLGSSSARLAANFVRLGLHPGMGATALLPALIGPSQATAMLLTGEVVSGERAAALGLLTRCCPSESLDDETEALASTLAALPSLALRQTVATLRQPVVDRLAAALGREASCQAQDFASPDVRAAIDAFRRQRSGGR